MNKGTLLYCGDCRERFRVYRKKKGPFCPYCGDCIEVRKVVRHFKKWTEQDKKDLVILKGQGMSIMKIAAKLGRSRDSITRQLQRMKNDEQVS